MSRRKNIIRSIMNRVKLKSQGCIAGLDKSCGLSSIQHATGLPDHVVARAAIQETNHPETPYKKDDGVHNETRGRILARLGYTHEELPARFKSFVHRTFSGRTITAKKRETAAEVAKRHPDKNLIVHAMSGAGPLHAFNIKYGKIYDRHGMAHPNDPVNKIFHVRRLNQEARDPHAETKKLFKLRLKRKRDGLIGGLLNSCGMASVAHATGLPDHVVSKAHLDEIDHPNHPYEQDRGIHYAVRRRVLSKLGFRQEKLPVYQSDTSGSIAKEHPNKNLIVHTIMKNGMGHAYNIKNGKIHDRYGIGHPNDKAWMLFHITKKKRSGSGFKIPFFHRFLNKEEYMLWEEDGDNIIPFRRGHRKEQNNSNATAEKHDALTHMHYQKAEKFNRMAHKAKESGFHELAHLYGNLADHHDTAGNNHLYAKMAQTHKTITPEHKKGIIKAAIKSSHFVVWKEQKLRSVLENKESRYYFAHRRIENDVDNEMEHRE